MILRKLDEINQKLKNNDEEKRNKKKNLFQLNVIKYSMFSSYLGIFSSEIFFTVLSFFANDAGMTFHLC